MGLEEIVAEVKKHDNEYVCLTGGEPLGQKGIYPLMRRLLDEKLIVSLETNGSFSIKDVPLDVIKVVDVKCPDSGETESMAWENLDLVRPTDQLKFVVASQKDFEWSNELCQERKLYEKCAVLFSPAYGLVKPADLAKWILNSKAKVTMQTQMHKEIWGPTTRGV